MTDWSAATPDVRFALLIETAILSDLDRLCTSSGSVETGGVLIGRYSPDLTTAIVTEVTLPPPDSQEGPSWFIRGAAGLCEMLRNRWRGIPRTYYIGEWHFHPSSIVEPSDRDLAQMRAICRDPAYHCAEPLLVILGTHVGGDLRAIRAFVTPREEEHKELGHSPA